MRPTLPTAVTSACSSLRAVRLGTKVSGFIPMLNCRFSIVNGNQLTAPYLVKTILSYDF